jgi:hypothetical protein
VNTEKPDTEKNCILSLIPIFLLFHRPHMEGFVSVQINQEYVFMARIYIFFIKFLARNILYVEKREYNKNFKK